MFFVHIVTQSYHDYLCLLILLGGLTVGYIRGMGDWGLRGGGISPLGVYVCARALSPVH